MTEGRLEVESKSQECLVIIKREVTSNNLPKRRVLSSTHGVVGGRRLVTASYPILLLIYFKITALEIKAFAIFVKDRVARMNNIRSNATEIVNNDLIYT